MALNPMYPANGLEINFLGLPMVFNDGKTENTLVIALTNNNFFSSLHDHDATIVFNQHTPLTIWFMVDVKQGSASNIRNWALTSYDALYDEALSVTISPAPESWAIDRHESLSGNPLNESLKGWQFTPKTDIELLQGQSLLVTLSGLRSNSPDGPTSCYCQVDMANLDDYQQEAPFLTKIIGPITKSKVMISGDRVGIGTGKPGSTLEVNGAVRARGGDPGDKGLGNNGFFFDGVGDADSGMASLDDGNLTLFVNDVSAIDIRGTGVTEDATAYCQIDATVYGDLHITRAEQGFQGQGGNLTVEGNVEANGHLSIKGPIRADNNVDVNGDLSVYGLSANGEATVGGNIFSQGRIYDKTGFVIPPGAILAYGGDTAPSGWLLCDGSPVPPDEIYKDLRGVVGDAVPDLRSRFVVGAGSGQIHDDQGHQLTTYARRSRGGAEFVTLTVDQMPSHSHSIDRHLYFHHRSFSGSDDGPPPLKRNREHADDIVLNGTDTTGDNQPHENRPPYYALTYIIKC